MPFYDEFPLICDFFEIRGNCGAKKIDDYEDYLSNVEEKKRDEKKTPISKNEDLTEQKL